MRTGTVEWGGYCPDCAETPGVKTVVKTDWRCRACGETISCLEETTASLSYDDEHDTLTVEWGGYCPDCAEARRETRRLL